MKKFLLVFLIIIISSCEKVENIQILNKELEKHVSIFIKEIEESKECKSKYITIRIVSDKIYISNSEPILSKNFIGFTKFQKSFLYFYSSGNYSNFISVKNNDFRLIEKDYNNGCDPSKDKILNIDVRDHNILRLYLPELNTVNPN
jgi:hypothetical protein